MSSLLLKHIYKVYPGGVRAVNDFNLEIKDKSFVVLVGPSGCGKSTTLRMIAGLEDITSGQLYIDKACVNDVDSKDRDIAMVFQSYALYPHMTVYQNMAFGLKLRHVDSKEIDRRVKAAAEILEISELLNRKPKELSGGQRQRVALGRTIVREPKVFLLDEPLSNLDAKLRVQMRTEITKLHEELQTTFIYVTHDQTEAMTMGDCIVVMKDGFIQQADSPITLFEDPANLFVATFLGSPQMNIIEGKLLNEKGTIKVVLEGCEENTVTLSSDISKQIIASKIDIEKPVLFGIRPDQIKILEKKEQNCVEATVEVVEQLGDETLLYTKITNHQKHFVVKTGLTGDISVGDKINLQISSSKVALFNKESEHSLIGLPALNKLPTKLNDNVLKVGNTEIKLSETYIKHLCAHKEDVTLGFKPEHVSLNEFPESIKLNVKVDFAISRTNYNAVFSKVDGEDSYIVFRVDKHSTLKSGDVLDIYVAEEDIRLYDEVGDRVYSREEINSNSTICHVVTTKKGQKEVRINGNKPLVYDSLDVEDGTYDLRIREDKVNVLFNKKVAKSLKLPYVAPKKGKVLQLSCYDEDPNGTTNFVYAKINGFADYVTIKVPNNFSVYKMPKFFIEVPVEALEFRK